VSWLAQPIFALVGGRYSNPARLDFVQSSLSVWPVMADRIVAGVCSTYIDRPLWSHPHLPMLLSIWSIYPAEMFDVSRRAGVSGSWPEHATTAESGSSDFHHRILRFHPWRS